MMGSFLPLQCNTFVPNPNPFSAMKDTKKIYICIDIDQNFQFSQISTDLQSVAAVLTDFLKIEP